MYVCHKSILANIWLSIIHLCCHTYMIHWHTFMYVCHISILVYIYVCHSHLHSHTYYMSAIDLYCHTYVYECLTYIYILLYICVSQSYIYTGINKCMSVINLYWHICPLTYQIFPYYPIWTGDVRAQPVFFRFVLQNS